jgi:hypothetical protein
MRSLSTLSLPMKMLCECGFDYRDFIAHHEIAEGAQIQCPVCDKALRVAPLQPAEENHLIGSGSAVPELATRTGG